MTISLTGFMGCGKSSVGRKLSELLCCRFTDLDALIEEQAGCSIPEIFERSGEKEFRRMEAEALRGLSEDMGYLGQKNLVLALGGGAVMTAECAEIVHERTTCIYLRTSVDELVNRLSGQEDGRPLLASCSALRKRILELMSQRAETYEQVAHLTVDTDGKSIAEISREIKERLQRHFTL